MHLVNYSVIVEGMIYVSIPLRYIILLSRIVAMSDYAPFLSDRIYIMMQSDRSFGEALLFTTSYYYDFLFRKLLDLKR